jgi:hypothetical protein
MVRNQSAPNEAISADYCNNNISITKSIWSVGGINTQDGTLISATKAPHRIYSDMIDISDGVTVSCLNFYEFCPFFYHADGSFAYSPRSYTSETLTIGPGQYTYMRLMVCNPETMDNKAYTLRPAVGESIVIAPEANLTWSSGTVDVDKDTNKEDENRIRTGFFGLHNGAITVTAADNAQFKVVYYDEYMKVLGQPDPDWVTGWISTEAPDRAVYARIVVRSASEDALTTDYGQNISVTFN